MADTRRWLRQRLGTWDDDRIDIAELVLSELVTNAVLHSHGPMRVSLSLRDDCAALEVVDATGGSVPVIHHYGKDATTGRGMHLIEELTAAWGVRGFVAGKGVWALLADPAKPGHATECLAEFTPDTWFLGDPTSPGDLEEPGTGLPPGTELARVLLVALPLRVYFAAREHNDALLREFRFLTTGQRPGTVPRRLLDLAAETRRHFADQGTAVRAQVEAAVARGEPTVDLALQVPRLSWDVLTNLSRLLDEADEFCSSGDLLSLSSPPIVRTFRAWYVRQVLDQLEGAGASPWSEPEPEPEPETWPGPADTGPARP